MDEKCSTSEHNRPVAALLLTADELQNAIVLVEPSHIQFYPPNWIKKQNELQNAMFKTIAAASSKPSRPEVACNSETLAVGDRVVDVEYGAGTVLGFCKQSGERIGDTSGGLAIWEGKQVDLDEQYMTMETMEKWMLDGGDDDDDDAFIF